MGLKKYQPQRTDFLINTDWGIHRNGMSEKKAKNKNMLLFGDRWVTKEEKKQLLEEYYSYLTVRILAAVLISFSIPIFFNIGEVIKGGTLSTFFTILYGIVLLAAGIGLFRYAAYAQKLTIAIFCTFFVLPFLPPMNNDKGALFLIVFGAIGFYFIFKESTRKIFTPPAGLKQKHD
jgi:predicted ABC-type exoprotein transport system permease subunit